MPPITKEQVGLLMEMQSTYRFGRRSKPGQVISDIICEIIDQITNKKWAEAVGSDEPDALANALEVAGRSRKPMTQAQMAERFNELEDENRQLKEQLGTQGMFEKEVEANRNELDQAIETLSISGETNQGPALTSIAPPKVYDRPIGHWTNQQLKEKADDLGIDIQNVPRDLKWRPKMISIIKDAGEPATPSPA